MTSWRKLLAEAVVLLREKWRLWLACGVLAATGTAALLPLDRRWMPRLVVADKPGINRCADQISFWGDFPRGWLLLISALALLGCWRRNRPLQIYALAALLAGSLAGIQAHSISSLTGRPRPSTGLADGLHGPTLNRAFKSFPSGHTTCAFAVATTLVASTTPWGIVAMVTAPVVAWSRMALNAHYPSDVWAGFWLGLANGLLFGLAARRAVGAKPEP